MSVAYVVVSLRMIYSEFARLNISVVDDVEYEHVVDGGSLRGMFS